jgi:hypothetical protein
VLLDQQMQSAFDPVAGSLCIFVALGLRQYAIFVHNDYFKSQNEHFDDMLILRI